MTPGTWVRVTGPGYYDGSRWYGKVGRVSSTYGLERITVEFYPGARDASHRARIHSDAFDQWEVFPPDNLRLVPEPDPEHLLAWLEHIIEES